MNAGIDYGVGATNVDVATGIRYGERPGENWDANKLVMWNALVRGTAEVCKQCNPAFDYGRFVTACGGLFDMDRRAA